jgi:O-antigen ligase
MTSYERVMGNCQRVMGNFQIETAVFGLVAFTFMLLPTGTAAPLIAMALAVMTWLISGAWRYSGKVVRQAWVWPVLLVVVLPWLGLTYSMDLDLGFDYAMKTKYWAVLLITAGFFMDDRRTLILVKALWIGLLSGSLVALVQFAGWAPLIKEDYPGFGIVHTLLSVYLIIGILMAGYYYRHTRNRQFRAVLLILLVCFVFHLAVLKGRSGYLIFALISPVVAGDLLYRFSFRMKLAATVLLVLSLVLSPVFRHTLTHTIQTFSANKHKAMKGENIEEMPRFFIFKQTMDAVKQSPVFGTGTGSLREISRPNGPAVTHPHNNILYMWVSFGVPGILACLWLFWTMFHISWAQRHTPLGYFVLSTCLVMFLGGMFDTQLLNTGTLLFFSLSYGFLGSLLSGKDFKKAV